MLFSTLSRRLLLLCLLVVLASCHSTQTVFQSSKLGKPQIERASASSWSYEVSTKAPEPTTPDKLAVKLGADKQRHSTGVAHKARVNMRQMLRRSVAVAKRTVQPHRITKPNIAAVQEEGEGKPALLILGIVLAVGGVIAGFVIGGGVGFFVGLPVFMLGYYFFMKGLLGPNAWIEVVNELFQL